jgi:hypothetical protein
MYSIVSEGVYACTGGLCTISVNGLDREIEITALANHANAVRVVLNFRECYFMVEFFMANRGFPKTDEKLLPA